MKETFLGDFSYKRGVDQTTSRNNTSRIFIIMGIALTAACIISTQMLAAQLRYTPTLGTPLLKLGGVPLYNPLLWALTYPEYIQGTPEESNATMFALVGFLMPLLMGVGICRLLRRTPGNHASVHGSARWATKKEIAQAGLCPLKGEGESGGVVVGGLTEGKRFCILRHSGPEHVMAFAPTRSGKGVGLVIPTLLEWEHSALVLDIKGENWDLTAGARAAARNNVLRFDPTGDPSEGHARYNPLEEIRVFTANEVADVQTLTGILCDPDGKGIEGDHWRQTARDLLVGTILFALHDPARNGNAPSLADIGELFSRGTDPYMACRQMQYATNDFKDADPERNAHLAKIAGIIREAMSDQISRSDKEAGSVLSTAKAFLTLYRDPIVAANTSDSTFRLHDIMNAKAPTSLYLVLKPSSMERLIPFIRIMLTQFIYTQTDAKMSISGGRAKSPHRHRCLMLLDEFPQLGRMPILEKAMAFTAGWGIKFYLITQDITQVRAAYGKEESISANCHIKIAYATGNPDTATLMSEMTGTTTIQKKSVSVTRRGGAGILATKDYTESTQEIQRALLTPDECAKIPGPVKNAQGDIVEAGDMLIFPAGFHAIYGKQVLYFREHDYVRLSKIAPPKLSSTFVMPCSQQNRREGAAICV